MQYNAMQCNVLYTTLHFPADEETVLVLLERVNEAQRLAARELRELQAQDPRKKKRKREDGDGEDGDDNGGGGGGGCGGHTHKSNSTRGKEPTSGKKSFNKAFSNNKRR